MAHDSNRIYIGSTGVEIADVQAVLGSTRNDIGALIRAVNSQGVHLVNKCSQYKPTRRTILGKLTDAQYKSLNWSYRIPSPVNLGSALANVLDEDNGDTVNDYVPTSNGESTGTYEYFKFGWWYKLPRGLATYSEPYMLNDFDGYFHNTSYVFDMEPQRSQVDSGALYVDMYWSIPLESFSSLEDMMFLAVVIKDTDAESGVVSYAKFKSGPASLSGTPIYTVVEFTSGEVGSYPTDGTNTSKVFTRGAGTYYVYGFLVPKSTTYDGKPIQNMDSTDTSTYYATMNTITGCFPLPVARGEVEFVRETPINPLAGLNFTFASGGSINMNRAYSHGSITVNFPALSATNSGPASKTIGLSTFRFYIHLEKEGDPSIRWDSGYYSMNLSGPVTIGTSGSTQVFSASDATNLSVTDATMRSVIEEAGGVGNLLVSAIVDDYDLTNYWPVATFAI